MPNLSRVAGAAVLALCAIPSHASIGSWIEPNLGQTDAAVRAIARDGEFAMLLESHRARLLLPHSSPVTVSDDTEQVVRKGALLMELVVEGADKQAAIEFGATMGGVSRYFRGADDSAWLSSVSHHDSVRFVDVYPGIDLVYRLRESRIEYDFLIDAGADPGQIALQLRGADRVAMEDGDLVATTKSGEIRQHQPEVFRIVDGELHPVAGHFRHDGNRFGFAVAGDEGHEIVIDPVIEFSTYLGGSGDDVGSDIAVNNRGNLIVNGTTMSLDIPGAPGGYTLGGQDIFVAEIDRGTSQLLWISFIGGSELDWSDALTVDSQGNVIVVGYTASPDFPTVNAFQATFAGSEDPEFGFNWDGLVVKLSDDGSQFVFSTYYGGLDWDSVSNSKLGFEWFRGVEVDAEDHIHVVGQTGAPDFPVTLNFRNRPCMETDAFSVNFFVSDIVLIEFAPDGTRQFATCIGGRERDAGRQVAFGPGGATYVGGFGRSSDLPVSVDAFQAVPPGIGIYTPFVLKLNSARSDIEWGTYFGGTDLEIMQEFAVGGDGSVYAVGLTESADFPVTPDALQPAINAGVTEPDISDAFVIKLRADGTALDYATFFGGAGDDSASAMRIDDAGRIYFAGIAESRDLILRTPLQSEPGDLYSNPLTIVANGPINAMATAVFGSVVFDAAAVMARDGVNQVAQLITTTSYEIVDIGTDANDTRDVIVGNYSSNFSSADFVFIEPGAPNTVYAYDEQSDVHVLDRTFGDPARDSRAVAPLVLGGGNSTDVVVANFGEANEIFLDAEGTPMLLGRADGNTVDVVTGSFGGFDGQADIIFANQGQDVRLYRNIGNMLYSSPMLLSAVSPNVSALATGNIDQGFTTDLIIGNSSGPLQIVRNVAGVVGPVEEIPGSSADTRALFLGDIDNDGDLDLFVGNNGPDRLYLNDGNGNFTPSDEFPEIDSLTLALAEEAFCTECEPFVGGPAGLSRHRRNNGDLMIAVIDPDAGTLEFSTYLEGGGAELVNRGLTFDSDGDILIAALTDGDAWPEVGAVQPSGGGGTDAVFIEIDVDIDDDGVLDGSDNCLEVANPAQRDTDNDAYGNFCDPDLNNDGVVNFADLQLFKDRIFGNDPDADLDGDGNVNFADLQLLKNLFFGAPGPSGLLLP